MSLRLLAAGPALALLLVLAGCRVESPEPSAPDPEPAAQPEAPSVPTDAVSMQGDDRLPSDADVERDRYTGRSQSADVDTTGRGEAQRANPERPAEIDSTTSWANRLHLPLGGDVEGPSVLKLQVLLDRARFSPGQIDGRWGDNTEAALVAFQRDASLKPTGIVDAETARALGERAGRPGQLVVEHRLTADDVAGPFRELPEDVYAKAELDALGYESLGEKLGERFHAAPALLQRLNDGATLDSLKAGDTIRVPNVMGAPAIPGGVARLVVSGSGHSLQALSNDGRVLFHAPATLGAGYDPSPSGQQTITGIARNPTWHYQPALLSGVPDDGEDAVLPGGPNNAVGTVWMSLSKPHYGIHGTRAPGTIGYASSSGCVRLTNWDAERLADAVRSGTTVEFRDIVGRGGEGGSSADSSRTSRTNA